MKKRDRPCRLVLELSAHASYSIASTHLSTRSERLLGAFCPGESDAVAEHQVVRHR